MTTTGSRLERFLAARSDTERIRVWFQLEDGHAPPSREQLVRALSLELVRIDRLIAEQLDAILHHPALQALESTWRGLRLLVDNIPEHAGELARQLRDPRGRLREFPHPQVLVRVLSVNWRELCRDFERVVDVQQSQLFDKVYSQEFGHPGGLPFGVLLGDYYVSHRVGAGAGSMTDDTAALLSLSQVAAAAFAPFITGVRPSLLGLDSFAELERPRDLVRYMNATISPEYAQWEGLRRKDDARFLALCGPRFVLRAPWRDDGQRPDGFAYRESSEQHSQWLWGNSVWAMGVVLARSFFESGWLAGIRGVSASERGGGLVDFLPTLRHETEVAGVAPRSALEVQVSDYREKELADLGIISLCQLAGRSEAAFYSTVSLQRPVELQSHEANASSRLSSMLHYILCASRFAHYLKVIGRDRTGSFVTADELERSLNKWLVQFAADSDELSDENRRKYPLAEGRVNVREQRGRPGEYVSEFHLRPHFQIDDLATAVRLTTRLVTMPTRRG